MASTENPVNLSGEHENCRLNQALDHLRDNIATHNTPPRVELALMSAFSKMPVSSTSLTRPSKYEVHGWRELVSQWLAPGIGLAASISTVAWVVFAPVPRPSFEVVNEQTMSDESPFIALQSLEAVAAEPSPTIIETKMSRIDLAAYGVPINPETAGDFVRTQMLVGATGRPLALRFQD